jgi:hypothetical protein
MLYLEMQGSHAFLATSRLHDLERLAATGDELRASSGALMAELPKKLMSCRFLSMSC